VPGTRITLGRIGYDDQTVRELIGDVAMV
jgi:hypothetical protein